MIICLPPNRSTYILNYSDNQINMHARTAYTNVLSNASEMYNRLSLDRHICYIDRLYIYIILNSNTHNWFVMNSTDRLPLAARGCSGWCSRVLYHVLVLILDVAHHSHSHHRSQCIRLRQNLIIHDLFKKRRPNTALSEFVMFCIPFMRI